MKITEDIVHSIVADAFPDLVEADPNITIEAKRLAGGLSRHTLLVDLPDHDRGYVVTVGKDEDDRLNAEHCTELKKLFAEKDVPHADHVAGPAGIEGTEYTYTIAKKVEGEHEFFPTEQQVEALGEALGKIHSIDVERVPPRPESSGSFRESLNKGIMQGKKILRRLGNEEDENRWRNLVPAVRGMLVEKSDAGEREDMPLGCIHGDIHPGNIMFSEDGVAAILDLERTEAGPMYDDVSRAIYYYCVDEDGKLNTDKTKAFFDGYNKHRMITKEELQEIPEELTVLRREKSTALWFLFYEKEDFPKLSKRTREMKNQIKDLELQDLLNTPIEELPRHEPKQQQEAAGHGR